MLGEKIGEFRGKNIGQRLLPSEGPSPRFEVTAEVSGTILGIAATPYGDVSGSREARLANLW